MKKNRRRMRIEMMTRKGRELSCTKRRKKKGTRREMGEGRRRKGVEGKWGGLVRSGVTVESVLETLTSTLK